jgi:hypothetical protein
MLFNIESLKTIKILHSPIYFSCEQHSLYDYLDVGTMLDYFICSLWHSANVLIQLSLLLVWSGVTWWCCYWLAMASRAVDGSAGPRLRLPSFGAANVHLTATVVVWRWHTSLATTTSGELLGHLFPLAFMLSLTLDGCLLVVTIQCLLLSMIYSLNPYVLVVDISVFITLFRLIRWATGLFAIPSVP